ncbi:MAG: S1 RNA-binding domain-containing protein [Chloroflexi bacterium]|nr:S1 RNA-binding domain-containing protein [Chloroflexota bacterium]
MNLNDSIIEEGHPMEAFLDDEGAYGMNLPTVGEIRTGTVARVTGSEVLVDVGAKSEGVIDPREVESMPTDERKALAPGEEISVYVVNPEDRNGNVVLSIQRAREEQDWAQAEALLESQEVYSSQIAGFNKGGLIVKVGKVRGFVPASQLSMSRRRRSEGESPEQKWGKMVGEEVAVKVIEEDHSRNRLILSERAAAREVREFQKERLLSELKEGEVRSGHVISLADFGAFVDIGGADGLVHLSELSWNRVAHPREVVEVGQKVKVKILNVDRERKRIGLSLKQLEQDPWHNIVRNFQPGQLVQGAITKLAKFGAFVRLDGVDELEGLIHVSELADSHVDHPRSVVHEGEVVTLRVLKVDGEKRRIGLSLKRVASAEYADADLRAAQALSSAAEDDLDEPESAGADE